MALLLRAAHALMSALSDNTILTFVRTKQYSGVLIDGLPLEHTIVVHSPFGFEFGYSGSGPADLALNILTLIVPREEAEKLHQEFKWDMIAGRNPEDTMTIGDVRNWIENYKKKYYTF